MTISELQKQLRQRDARIKQQDARIKQQAARIKQQAARIKQQAARIKQQAARIKEQAARIKGLEREVEELKKLLVEKAQSKEAKVPKEATNYSVGRHERKQRRKRRCKKSTGRMPKEAKSEQATQHFDLYWHDAGRKQCVLRREQFVWRLIDGKAQ